MPVSVMTLEEIRPIADELGLQWPMIIEGGNAIARREEGEWVVEPCGPPADVYLDVIRRIEDASGASLLVYSALPDSDAEQLSGRHGAMLNASRERRYSEPFLLESGDLRRVERAAASLGYAVRQGRRFLHLTRDCDQGEAVARVIEELGCDVTIAVGGSPLDAEFMQRAKVAISIPGPDGQHDETVIRSVRGVRLADEPAPVGWAVSVAEACQTILSGGRKSGRTQALSA